MAAAPSPRILAGRAQAAFGSPAPHGGVAPQRAGRVVEFAPEAAVAQAVGAELEVELCAFAEVPDPVQVRAQQRVAAAAGRVADIVLRRRAQQGAGDAIATIVVVVVVGERLPDSVLPSSPAQVRRGAMLRL